jgi:hypothetical protein
MFMRKTFLVVLMLSAAVYGISAQTVTTTEAGVIRELSGKVELKHAGASAFVNARVGDEIAQDTIISTGFKSSAILTVGSSTITVWPLTRLSLAEIQMSADTENLNVNLQAGKVKVDVKPPAGLRANYKVQNPMAVASVRGTSFEFDMYNITVKEGRVSFSGASGLATMVSTGGANFIGTNREPVPISNIIEGTLVPSSPVGTAPAETLTQTSSPVAGNGSVFIQYPNNQ